MVLRAQLIATLHRERDVVFLQGAQQQLGVAQRQRILCRLISSPSWCACRVWAQQQLCSWLQWLHAHLMCNAFLQGVQQHLGVAQAERDSRTRQLQDLQGRLQELQSALRRAQDPLSHRWALLSRAGKTGVPDVPDLWPCMGEMDVL